MEGLGMRTYRKKSAFFTILWMTALMIVGGAQKSFTHDIHGPDTCHVTLIIQLRTDYLESEIDTVRVSCVSGRTGATLARTTTPVRLGPVGTRVFEFVRAHDSEEFLGTVELSKDGVLVADRPFRVTIPRDFNCFTQIVTVLISKPQAVAVQTYELIEDKDFNGVPSEGDILLIRAQIDAFGQSSGTAKYVNVPKLNLRLVPGTVQASSGEITVGNEELDFRVVVADIPLDRGPKTVDVTFEVEVLPLFVASQGQIFLRVGTPGDDYQTATFGTDDIDTAEKNDPTLIPVKTVADDPKDPFPPPN